MRTLLFLLALSISINGIAQETKWNLWTKKYTGQKNHFPEYGNLHKSKDEIKADNDFIETITKLGYSKQDGSKQLAIKGWTFLRQGDYENAMLRFNQSWLLNNSNVNALWGFGTLMGILENCDDAIKYLELAYKTDSTVSRLLVDIATAYLIRFNINNDKNDLNTGLPNLLKFLKVESKNEEALYKTSIFYFHLGDYNSAWTYLNECKDNGGRPIQDGYVNSLSEKMRDPTK